MHTKQNQIQARLTLSLPGWVQAFAEVALPCLSAQYMDSNVARINHTPSIVQAPFHIRRQENWWIYAKQLMQFQQSQQVSWDRTDRFPDNAHNGLNRTTVFSALFHLIKT